MKPLVAMLVLVATALNAARAEYPERAIHIVVPIPPGGAPDLAARIVGARLSAQLGQPVVIENRSGSNGIIAAESVAKAQPDGYTLLMAPDSLITVNPHLYAAMPFDPLVDLLPVAPVAINEFVLSVNPSLPVKTFEDFIAFAKHADPPLAYASAGNGSQHHLAMEMLQSRAGIQLTHVPFRGGAYATLATVAGDTQVMFAGSSTLAQIQGGKLRAIATAGSRRSREFPDLPRIADFYPGFEVTIWLGLFAPPHTPPHAVERLRTEVKHALAAPEVKEKLRSAGGMSPFDVSIDEFEAQIRSDHAKYGRIVHEIGVKVD
jgi:tripartite-type tricarboxylate transporter receptor subunit TctC